MSFADYSNSEQLAYAVACFFLILALIQWVVFAMNRYEEETWDDFQPLGHVFDNEEDFFAWLDNPDRDKEYQEWIQKPQNSIEHNKMLDGAEVDAQIMGGAPVMKNTRIPVRTILRRLAEGDSVDVLHQDYPHLKRSTLETLNGYVRWEGPHPEGCLCAGCRAEGFGTKHV